MDPKRYTGRSKEQVEEFIQDVIQPILTENQELLGLRADIKV